jgi:hypothetical protein
VLIRESLVPDARICRIEHIVTIRDARRLILTITPIASKVVDHFRELANRSLT